MKFLARFKNWCREKFAKTTAPAVIPEESLVTEPETNDSAVYDLLIYPDGKMICAEIRILTFENFADARGAFKAFICDGSCDPRENSMICFHQFEFKCPACAEKLQFYVEEMELLTMFAGKSSVCYQCFDKLPTLKREAAA